MYLKRTQANQSLLFRMDALRVAMAVRAFALPMPLHTLAMMKALNRAAADVAVIAAINSAINKGCRISSPFFLYNTCTMQLLCDTIIAGGNYYEF
jgi:hypothetical protein